MEGPGKSISHQTQKHDRNSQFLLNLSVSSLKPFDQMKSNIQDQIQIFNINI